MGFKKIKDTLFINAEKIAEKLWAPNLQGWKVWIIGTLDSEEIRFSEPISGGTKPNPANYDKDEWLLELPFWTDIADMSQEEIEKAEKENMISSIIMEDLQDRLLELAEKAIFPARR